MKNTIRILSLVLCLAMLVGVFAASAFAAEEEKVYAEMDFTEQPVSGVDPWSSDYHTNAFSWVPGTTADPDNQHAVLTHANAEANTRVYLGYVNDPANGIVFERGKIAAKDLTFDAKIDGSDMKIEFYVHWNLKKTNGDEEVATRRVTIDVKGDKIYNGATEVGTIPATVDVSEWHTWTARLSRQSGYSGDYDVQLMIDGVNYITGDFIMTTQGSNPQERFAIHARSEGTIEIDNLKLEELYLDSAKGPATTGTVTTLWESGFGALGTELTYDDTDNSYTAGQWKRGTHANTTITFVEDATAGGEEEGGYLKASYTGNSDRYANFYLNGYEDAENLLPSDEKFWVQLDVKLEDEAIGFQVGFPFNDKGTISGRLLTVRFLPDGLYYKTSAGMVKAEFELPTVTEWNSYIFEVDPQKQEATVYANGVALGKIAPQSYTYTATHSNYTQFKISTPGANELNGAAYIDNIKVTSGVSPIQTPQGPGNTADASIIGLAAMMLPVSGIGMGALCLKRKKEN